MPFPSPMHESESESEVAQSCPTLSDPTNCSPPVSSVHGIFQARVLEWGAIAFFDTYALIYSICLSLSDLLHFVIGSRFIHLIRTDSNVFLFMAD